MTQRVRLSLAAALLPILATAQQTIRTGDGIELNLSDTGTTGRLSAGGSVFRSSSRPLFSVREMGTDTWTAVDARFDGTRLVGESVQLGLGIEATFRAGSGRIEIKGALIDQRGEERDAQLLCALPARCANVRWHLDTVEAADPFADPGNTSPVAAEPGHYHLWVDAFDFDPGMGSVSVLTPSGSERLLAVLARPGAGAAVDQKWRTLLVPGIRNSDFSDGALRIRIGNFQGGYLSVDIGGLFLMDCQAVTRDEEQANLLLQKSESEARKLSSGSWVCAPAYRPRPGARAWGHEQATLRVEDGAWIELKLQRGQHLEGGMMRLGSGHLPMRPDGNGELPALGYPWATVTEPGAGGFTLGVSPRVPCPYRFSYEADAGAMQLVLSYGLSTHPRRAELKSRAPFHLVLYRSDDEWGFREATRRYYELAPELFQRPTQRLGFWYGAGAHRDYRGVEGEFAFLEVHEARLYPRRFLATRDEWALWHRNLAEYFPRHAELGILVLPYRHFYHCSLHVKGDMDGTLPHMPGTYEEAMAMLRTLPLPFGNGYAHHIRDLIESSTMRLRDGRFDVKLSADDPCAPTGRLIFRTSISPYLYEDQPDVMTNARAEMEFAQELLNAHPDVGGIYYDAGAGGGGVTYAPEHLRCARSPLAPGPGIGRMAGKYEFGRWMGEYLHSRGKVHFVNGGAGMGPAQTWHILPFDCIGVEWPPLTGAERVLRFLRVLAGKKPVSFLNIRMEGDISTAFRTYVGLLGIHGIFPPPHIVRSGGSQGSAAADELTAPYAALLQTMYVAGWEPVTHAVCDPRHIRIERYGPKDNRVYFALFNPTFTDASVELNINAQAVGLPAMKEAVVHFGTGSAAMLKQLGTGKQRVTCNIRGRQFVVVEAGVDAVDDPRRVADLYPSRLRAWKAEAVKPRLLGHWTLDEPSGQVARDTSGNGAHAVLGRSPDADTEDPERVAGGHAGAALRFDGKDDVVRVPPATKLRILDSFTIEVWIKRQRRTTHARVVDFGGTCMYFEGDGDRLGLRIGAYSVNTAWSTPIPLQTWTQVKASYDGKTIRMVVDGKLCGTRQYECGDPIRASSMSIGNAAQLPRPFAGLIDDVRLWNHAR